MRRSLIKQNFLITNIKSKKDLLSDYKQNFSKEPPNITIFEKIFKVFLINLNILVFI